MKLPYREGTVFLVPLESGGYVRGLVVRSGKRGRVLFGHFWGPRLDHCDHVEMSDLHAYNAIFSCRFGDLHLIDGRWIVCGELPAWERSQWPMPAFWRQGFGKPVRVHRSDLEPGKLEKEVVIEEADKQGLVPDSLCGAGYVEIRLTKLLDGGGSRPA